MTSDSRRDWQVWRTRQAGRVEAFTVFLVAACAVLAILVVLLSRQNMKLKEQISNMPVNAPAEKGLQPGDSLGSLTLVNEAGEKRQLVFGEGEAMTLLLVFSMTCPACEATIPIWNEMVGEISDPAIRVVGARLDSHRDTETDPEPMVIPAFPFPVSEVEQAESDAMQHIPYIPATILLDGNGTVVKAWYGILEDSHQADLRDALSAPPPAPPSVPGTT